jgi:phospholipid/cholesterol/gamma-HCH transport system substrate-binding protein
MKMARLETVVGVFVLIGILCLGYLSIRLGKMEVIGGHYYEVYAEFDSVSGLKKGASVEIAGVEVGRVDRIVLSPRSEMARVYLKIQSGVRLTDDVIASVRSRGIIGDKFLKLAPGGADSYLAPGAKIRNTESAVDLEELIGQFIHGKV